MTHSITAFDRKYLAPDMSKFLAGQQKRRENCRIALIVILAVLAIAFHHFVLPGLLHVVSPELF